MKLTNDSKKTFKTRSIIKETAYKVATKAAIRASQHILHYWPNPSNTHFDQKRVLHIFEKNQGVGNYATIADTESEEIILSSIKNDPILKEHGIITEESADQISQSEYQWVIDPIDGTLAFKNGLHDFGVAIGLLKNKQPVLGIIAMPAFNQLIVAQYNQGARLISFEEKVLADITKIHYTQPIDKAVIGFDTGYESRGKQMQNTVQRIADNIGYPVSYASSSAANFRLALGGLGGYFHQTPTKYDIGAASVIIPEVGGIVTDMQGNSIDWSAKKVSYLAARTPELHAQLLEMIMSY